MISECIVSDHRGLSGFFKEHFINTTKTLELEPSIISIITSLPEVIETFKNHSSIKKNFSLQKEECQFKFHFVNVNEVKKVILNIDQKSESNWMRT